MGVLIMADTNNTTATDDSTTTPSENQELREVTAEMFQNISALLVGELKSSSEDYVLLEQMNTLTAQKYSEMAGNAEGLTEFMKQLRDKYESFQPFLEKIDQVEVGIQSLEQTVLQLDEYSKRLEMKYRQLNHI